MKAFFVEKICEGFESLRWERLINFFEGVVKLVQEIPLEIKRLRVITVAYPPPHKWSSSIPHKSEDWSVRSD